jgi:hypothetical protein
MVQYDPALIQQFADRLYRKAGGIVLTCTALGLLTGGLGGFVVGRNGMLALFCLCGGGLIGCVAGQARAFQLRLKAQLTLCQMWTEAHTRAIAITATTPQARPPGVSKAA